MFNEVGLNNNYLVVMGFLYTIKSKLLLNEKIHHWIYHEKN